jgi:hypothetical protein
MGSGSRYTSWDLGFGLLSYNSFGLFTEERECFERLERSMYSFLRSSWFGNKPCRITDDNISPLILEAKKCHCVPSLLRKE